MTDDIVTRLRAVLHSDRSVELMNREAANEIEDLRFQLSGTQGELDNALSRERTLLDEQEDCRIGADNLHSEIERFRAERDEARRMWCEAEAVGNCLSVDDMYRRARAEAKRREWDCYKEDGK